MLSRLVKLSLYIPCQITNIIFIQPVESFLQEGNALQPYTLILVTAPVASEVLTAISAHTQKHHVPLFYIHSVGFYSKFSLSLPPAFPIVDTHPDPTAVTDLRLLNPWPALIEFAKEKTHDLASMSEHDIGHVPYVLLLLRYIEEWKASHDGLPPTNYKDKTDFRELVRKAAPSADEENFVEAAAAVLKSLNPPKPSSSVLKTLNAPEAQTANLTPDTSSFWYIANAIGQFYQIHNELPLPGAVPDMKARSADYIRLQNIYKARARQDSSEVLDIVRNLESSVGRPKSLAIDDKEVDAFCKGAAHVKLVRGTPLLLAHAGKGKKLEWGPVAASTAATGLMMPAESGILITIAFLAWDTFVSSHETESSGGGTLLVPGLKAEDVESDGEKVVGIAHKVLDDVITEAGSFVENPEYDTLKTDLANIVKEM